MTRRNFAPALSHQIAIAAAFVVVLTLVLLLSPGRAMAGVSGQIGEAWGPSSEFEGEQLIFPTESGFDPSDGSVYISATSEDESETVIRKFTSTGELKGSLRLPTRAYQGIAVDPTHHRFYLLAVARPGEQLEATKVLAFSTIPVDGELVAADPAELTLPTGTEALLEPAEIVVDPSTGDLVILATEEHGVEPEPIKEVTTLQRIDIDPLTGAMSLGARFVNEVPITRGRVLGRAVAVDKAGATYLLGAGEDHGEPDERLLTAETLPANFTAASTLTPLPGFEAAVAEGHGSLRQGLISIGATGAVVNRGPQIAVTTSATGEDTLYWKVLTAEGGNFIIESWSVDGEARASVFGGGSQEEECKISTSYASLGAEENGDLAVFDGGTLASLGEPLEFFPVVYHFGPGGSGCPAPAPGFTLESEGGAATTVEAGALVAANPSETELNDAAALEGGTWKVEGPEEFTEPVTSLTSPFEHRFKLPGPYTIRLSIEAEALTPLPFGLGNVFSAQPRELHVTAAPPATVTGVSPDEGPTAGGTEVTITGTNLAGTTEVKFGSEAVACTEVVTTCKVESDTEVKATVPALTAGPVDVHVVTAAGESAANPPSDQFTAVSPPTITGISPDEGPTTGGTEVTITGTGLAGTTEVKFGSTAVACTEVVTTCKVESDTEVKATVPVLTAGPVDVHVVTGGGESPANPTADQFTAITPPELPLAVSKGGPGVGTVTSSPAGIDCGTACEGRFVVNTSVTLTATAAAGSSFGGWGGACSGTAATCVVSMDAARTVTATFNANPPQNNTQTPPIEQPHTLPIETKPNPKPTQKQIIAKKRQAALKKCQKLKGKAKEMCVKKANQIGKPKKKAKKVGGNAMTISRVSARLDW